MNKDDCGITDETQSQHNISTRKDAVVSPSLVPHIGIHGSEPGSVSFIAPFHKLACKSQVARSICFGQRHKDRVKVSMDMPQGRDQAIILLVLHGHLAPEAQRHSFSVW